ncbi:MAG: single-stranded-DNA-specific exonuclease RecJ [Candidatus Brocadiia bacterium]
MEAKWNLPPDRSAEVERLAAELHVSQLTAQILVNRGVTRPEAARRFLQPELHALVDPCEDPLAVEAADFLLQAARSGKRITIFGDYDADGICAAAVLMRTFRFLGTDAEIYIPHRVEEGYGLNHDALAELARTGTEVVVTVDCGISAAREVEFARESGMEVVVTDHHEPRDATPDALHVVNPKLPDCSVGYEYLAGVGVAFKLVWAIGQRLSGGERVSEEFRDLLMEALALVAIGTVADVVPLRDENRVLVSYGLKTIGATGRPGLDALLAVSRLNPDYLTARDIAFRLAPLLNAAGRMGHPAAAVELLTTRKADTAEKLARELDQTNRLRRKVQHETCTHAEQMAEADETLAERSCIVLSHPEWHQGVVGLVASRLAERYNRPTFVFARDEEYARGSARSIPGFPLYTAVCECADLLEEYGGHQGAAGLTLRTDNLPAFVERINGVAAELMAGGEAVPEMTLDGEIDLRRLNHNLVREISRLEPFGEGNPQPVFAASGLKVVGNPRVVGSTSRHLAFMVRQNDTTLRAFAMGKADWARPLRERKGEPLSLAFEPSINTYRGRNNLELRVRDMQWDAERVVDRLEV